MPADQAVELLIGRRREPTYVVPARYAGNYQRDSEEPPRRLTDLERAAVARAGAMLTDAIGGRPVDEVEAQNAIELLHRLSLATEGEPRYRLADGRLVVGEDVAVRAAL